MVFFLCVQVHHQAGSARLPGLFRAQAPGSVGHQPVPPQHRGGDPLYFTRTYPRICTAA